GLDQSVPRHRQARLSAIPRYGKTIPQPRLYHHRDRTRILPGRSERTNFRIQDRAVALARPRCRDDPDDLQRSGMEITTRQKSQGIGEPQLPLITFLPTFGPHKTTTS